MPDGAHYPLPSPLLPGGSQKGRGAVSNPHVRYEAQSAEAFDDGWGSLVEDIAPLRTTLTREAAKSALSYNDSPDIGFDRSLNPYRGCEHGCVYCFARPSHAYVGLSPGLDFETKILFKPDMPEILARELSRPGYTPKPVTLGANTDPYQPLERHQGLTRRILEVLERFNHPVSIVTKGAGVLRDIDILARMAKKNLVRVCVSITTLDAKLARVMEPRAASPVRRLEAVRQLSAAGIPVAVLAAPMIPGINDAELEKIVEASARAGATSAGYVLLRLPLELKQIFEDWLNQHFPDRAAKVLALIRQTRGGKLYDSAFGQRQSGQGPYAGVLGQRFALALKRAGLAERLRPAPLDCGQFNGRVDDRQLALL